MLNYNHCPNEVVWAKGTQLNRLPTLHIERATLADAKGRYHSSTELFVLRLAAPHPIARASKADGIICMGDTDLAADGPSDDETRHLFQDDCIAK